MRNKSLETMMTNIRQFRMDAGCYPAILRLDNDSTFTSHEFTKFCNENLIKLEYCQPYRHQQNGLAERAIRSINATARVLMIAGNIPERYWGYVCCHSCCMVAESNASSMGIICKRSESNCYATLSVSIADRSHT